MWSPRILASLTRRPTDCSSCLKNFFNSVTQGIARVWDRQSSRSGRYLHVSHLGELSWRQQLHRRVPAWEISLRYYRICLFQAISPPSKFSFQNSIPCSCCLWASSGSLLKISHFFLSFYGILFQLGCLSNSTRVLGETATLIRYKTNQLRYSSVQASCPIQADFC